jgi:prepilin-type N-terminal cleavage/methylation domain-containing protein
MLARAPEHEREDAGFTLVEILVALVILSVCVIGLVGVLTSLMLSTQHHRGLGATDTVARDFGEAVKKQAIHTTAFVKCPQASDVNATFPYDATKFTPSLTTVEYWIPTTVGDPLTGTFTTDRTKCVERYEFFCGTSVRPECNPGLLRITLTVDALAANMKGGKTTTQVLVRRGNTP